MILRDIRIISQTVFTVAFFGSLLFLNQPEVVTNFNAEWFLRINPLVALVVSVATRSIATVVVFSALPVFIVTLFFGRVFCGYICPLGALIDLSDFFLFKKHFKHKYRVQIFWQKSKYLLLILVLVVAISGSLLSLFFDPISILTRISTLLLLPFLSFEGRKVILASGGFAAFIMLVLILGAGVLDKRFWCQYICPTGAFLGIISHFTFFRREYEASTCNSCKSCHATCPTRAIDLKEHSKTMVAECILCGYCSYRKNNCNKVRLYKYNHKQILTPDLKKRHVIGTIGAGVLLLPTFGFHSLNKDNGKLIRPPASRPENLFGARCIACGECIKVCPGKVLQPCGINNGLRNIFTPTLDPQIGSCLSDCNACGEVCPTQAIFPTKIEDKPYLKMGTAIVDKFRCVSWSQGKECMVCLRVCPYGAIISKSNTMYDIPAPKVSSTLCTGCGACEYECPVMSKSAIEIYNTNQIRHEGYPLISVNHKKKVDNAKSNSEIIAPPSNIIPEDNSLDDLMMELEED